MFKGLKIIQAIPISGALIFWIVQKFDKKKFDTVVTLTKNKLPLSLEIRDWDFEFRFLF